MNKVSFPPEHFKKVKAFVFVLFLLSLLHLNIFFFFRKSGVVHASLMDALYVRMKASHYTSVHTEDPDMPA